MKRRYLLAAGCASLGMVTACGVLTPAQLKQDAEAVANGIATIATALQAVIPNAATQLFQTIEAAATTAGQDATALSGLFSTSGAAADIAGIVTVVTTFDGLVAQYFPAAAPIVNILNALLVLTEGLYTDAGLTPPAAGVANTRGIRPKFGVPIMPIDIARATLSHVNPRGANFR